MNAKLAKKTRALVRGLFSHQPLRSLTHPTQSKMVPDYSAGLNLNGTLKMVPFTYTGTSVNVGHTQRATYRFLKVQAGEIRSIFTHK